MDKIKWAVIGTAGIAKGQTIPGMLEAENCELYGIAGRNPEKAKAYQDMFGFKKVYDSYEAALNDPEVEAVYIPLPNSLHCEWAMKALQAKKHVLCEKPLAPDAATAEKMIQCANENGVFLMEAFAYLHTPFTAAVKEVVDSGEIGDVLYMESAFLTSDHDLSNIRMRKETFGGSVYDVGCYNTSQILWIFGGEAEKAQAVAEYTEQGIDKLTTGILTFADGKKATFTCGMLLTTEMDARVDRFQIHGTKGKIMSDVEFNQKGDLSFRVVTEKKDYVKTIPTRHNYALEVEQLGRCIRNGETPFVSNEFSMRNARTVDKVLKAIGY